MSKSLLASKLHPPYVVSRLLRITSGSAHVNPSDAQVIVLQEYIAYDLARVRGMDMLAVQTGSLGRLVVKRLDIGATLDAYIGRIYLLLKVNGDGVGNSRCSMHQVMQIDHGVLPNKVPRNQATQLWRECG